MVELTRNEEKITYFEEAASTTASIVQISRRNIIIQILTHGNN